MNETAICAKCLIIILSPTISALANSVTLFAASLSVLPLYLMQQILLLFLRAVQCVLFVNISVFNRRTWNGSYRTFCGDFSSAINSLDSLYIP
ncbi:MAG: hypothetical protein EZS28_012402 [Streblomastix strix]|uniref:Uncharacterized protein n=1 Tax=Streblomastix strix TaxID=222440 RepID=A0A5J4WBY3_9EUKA|nr:MAG: hypothetical protein EZS28_012402 [Streblomastix strix]